MDQLKVFAAHDETQLDSLEWTSEAELESWLSAAFAAHESRAWLGKSERLSILDRASRLIDERVEELARLAAQEGGKPLIDSRVEIRRAAEGIRAAIAVLHRDAGREIPMGLTPSSTGRIAYTHHEPRGVVGAISAFNHPFNLIVHQVVPAVATGCPVLVKPASKTPLSCRAVIEILREAGLPEASARMVLLPRALTEKWARDERLSFLSFIGSAAVGWKLRAGLGRGVDCALEHGGVAPVVIDSSADLEQAVPALLKGAYYHAGQVCVSVQRIYVARALLDDFVEQFSRGARELVVGDPLAEETTVGPLIDPSEVERVDAWVKEAEQAGGKILLGGERLSKTTYAPTLVLDPPDDVRLSREEVFGPVVAVYPYDDLDEAIARANAPASYFQAAVFTRDLDRALDVARRLHGTTVMVNDHTAFRVDWMPFGGKRSSGLGWGGIEDSMRDMTNPRLIVIRSPSLS